VPVVKDSRLNRFLPAGQSISRKADPPTGGDEIVQDFKKEYREKETEFPMGA